MGQKKNLAQTIAQAAQVGTGELSRKAVRSAVQHAVATKAAASKSAAAAPLTRAPLWQK